MKKTIALILALALCLGLTACGPKSDPAADSTPAPTATPAPTQEPAPASTPEPLPDPEPSAVPVEVNLAVLSGPTGVGAAKLLADNEAGSCANHYNVTVATDNTQITAGLINGEFDIAAVATNVASNLYHKTNGAVQIAAINTLGVLYILGRDEKPISSLADLGGKTLYATGQGANPEFVLNYLLAENEVTGVDIVWKPAEEVTAAMLQGQGDYCMLPVPAATALQAKSEGQIKSMISLSEEWDALENGSQLTMGCVVVRTEFAQANPQAVNAFLEEYAASIEYVRGDPAAMAQTIADLGIAPSAPIAQKAIPQCNLVYLDGEDMRNTIQGYYEVLYAADPSSIGGGIPDDAFYFMGG